LLLAAILGLHLVTRLEVHEATPLSARLFFPTSYLFSLSLISGQGFNYLLPKEAGSSTTLRAVFAQAREAGGPAERVMSFISASGPARLSGREFADYLAQGAHPVPVRTWERTRTLDIYLTALLWKLFGISWDVYFAFYALVSATACFAIFSIARRLSGSYWCGVIGAVGFLASPLENYATVWSPRDTNPLWFAAFAFAVLLRFAEPSPSRVKTYLGWAAVGFVSLLGLGWRPDAQLLPPFVLAGLLALLAVGRHPKGRLLAATGCFLAGCLAVRLVVGALGPGGYSQSGTVFHTAWYGEHARSDLLWTENAFQVVQSDYLTLHQSNYFHRRRNRVADDVPPNRITSDPAHFRRCRDMYVEMARYNAYTWWARFPGFLREVAHVDRPTALQGQVGEAERFLAGRPGWLRPAHQVFDRYGAVLPALFVLGATAGLLRRESVVGATLLAAYFVYYAAALFLVLPLPKHFLQLLLPLHVLAAVGVWFAIRSITLRPALGEVKAWARRTLPWAGVAVAVLGVCWALVAMGAHGVSREQRSRFVASIRGAAANGAPAPETLKGRKLFTVSTEADAPSVPVGYLLRVRGAPRPVELVLAHVRERTSKSDELSYYTRHRLEPDREQYFFFNVVSGTGIGDDRPYTAIVRVRGRAEILSATRVDLSQWSLGLPLSFVFDENDERVGSPFIAPILPTEETYASRAEIEASLRPAE
jgi:hypothetical protein